MRKTGYIFRHLGVKILDQKGDECLCILEMLLTLKLHFPIIIFHPDPSTQLLQFLCTVLLQWACKMLLV